MASHADMERWRAHGQFTEGRPPENTSLPRTEVLRLGPEVNPQLLVNLRHGVSELPDGSLLQSPATFVQNIYEVEPAPDGIAYIAAALHAEAAATERDIDTVAINLPPSLGRSYLMQLGYRFLRTDRLYQETPMTITLSERESLLGKHAEHFSSGRILDVGAGWGLLTQEMARKGAQVTAVEPDTGEHTRLVELQKLLGIPFETLQARIEVTQLAREYDGIVARHSLHFLDPVFRMEAFRKLGDALKPQGMLYVEGWLGTLRDDSECRYPFMYGELEHAFPGWEMCEDTLYELDGKKGQLAQRFVVKKPA